MTEAVEVLPAMALHFELGGRSFALPVEGVRELLPHVGLELLAEPPPDVSGVLRVRGQVVPVLELRARLGLSPASPPDRIVVMEREGATLGLAVEAVHEVFVLEEPYEAGAEPAGLTRGLVECDERLVTLLDLRSYFARSRELAVRAPEEAAGEDSEAESLDGLHLTLMAGGELLALPVGRVQEILEYRGHTQVPRAPRFVSGVMDLRGTVIPVVRLAELLGITPAGPFTRVVVLEASWDADVNLVGLLVEDVDQVVPISSGDIVAPPRMGMHIRPAFVSGVTHIAGRPVFLVEPDRVLDLDALSEVP